MQFRNYLTILCVILYLFVNTLAGHGHYDSSSSSDRERHFAYSMMQRMSDMEERQTRMENYVKKDEEDNNSLSGIDFGDIDINLDGAAKVLELMTRMEIERMLSEFWRAITDAWMSGDDSTWRSIAPTLITEDFRFKSSIVEGGWFEGRDAFIDSTNGYLPGIWDFCGGTCDLVVTTMSMGFTMRRETPGVIIVQQDATSYIRGNSNSFNSVEYEQRQTTFVVMDGRLWMSQDENLISSLN